MFVGVRVAPLTRTVDVGRNALPVMVTVVAAEAPAVVLAGLRLVATGTRRSSL